MKRILMIGTGGTIASQISGNALSPQLRPDELLALVPAISKLCEVECISLFNVDSTSMTPAHWVQITKCVRDNYDKYDGFVISHGTDTMAYTAAALSYMIRGSKKPVILTGAQKPINFESTDSKVNLLDAFTCACSDDMCGVNIVFNGRVILGTRARKTRSKSYAAFSSINYPYKAVIQDKTVISYDRSRKPKAPIFYDKLDGKVGLFKMTPGADARILDRYFELSDAVIVESFGVGGIPDGEEFDFYDVIEKWRKKGKIAVMCTQVVNEGSDMTVYKVGKSLKEKYGFLESYDMTPEAVICKLMWILALTRKRGEIKRLFYKNIAQDILYGD